MQLAARVSSIFSTVTEFYKDINPATLSGAIDVVVVQHKNGELSCSPFHVRFGKLKVLRPHEKVVEVLVNGEPVEFPMKVGEAGEAFFVIESETPVPQEYATSPIPAPTDVDGDLEPLDLNQGEPMIINDGPDGTMTMEVHQDIKINIDTNAPPRNREAFEPTSAMTDRDANGYVSANSGNSDFEDSESDHEPGLSPTSTFIPDTATISSIKTTTTATTTSTIPVPEPALLPEPVADNLTESDVIVKKTTNTVETTIDIPPETQAIATPQAILSQVPKLNETAIQMAIDATKDATDSMLSPGRNRSNTVLSDQGTQATTRGSAPASDHPFSDTELEVHGSKTEKQKGPLSDTEYEFNAAQTAEQVANQKAWTWGWGSLPKRQHPSSAVPNLQMKRGDSAPIIDSNGLLEAESKEVSKDAKNVLAALEGLEGVDVEMSLCGFKKDLTLAEFQSYLVSHLQFSSSPSRVLSHPDLVYKIQDSYYPPSVALPVLMSLLIFGKSLPQETISGLCKNLSKGMSPQEGPDEDKRRSRFGDWKSWWSRSGSVNVKDVDGKKEEKEKVKDGSVEVNGEPKVSDSKEKQDDSQPQRSATQPPLSDTESRASSPSPTPSDRLSRQERNYAKTLRLTSDQLKKLNLQPGMNSITFSVVSNIQGRASCTARVFLWDEDAEVVISDIDGTITKSDALGHLFTMVGKDWTHSGVAPLYTAIRSNGYHILYLTSRAIGQAQYTRNYLTKVEQGQYQLPDGPVIMSPDRLVAAFTREVIQRRPEEFKIACLRDIKKLFGDRNPFYAGFGNRTTVCFASLISVL
ncbi:Lipin/Ned1/Smp2-domain-containing protein [Paraphysoderma sedebokerense]|nr:Lipin/Ned1/Smp2-domain-containing protein [Paraphysoderma sedebokerense]